MFVGQASLEDLGSEVLKAGREKMTAIQGVVRTGEAFYLEEGKISS